jgi:hypothetical protein
MQRMKNGHEDTEQHRPDVDAQEGDDETGATEWEKAYRREGHKEVAQSTALGERLRRVFLALDTPHAAADHATYALELLWWYAGMARHTIWEMGEMESVVAESVVADRDEEADDRFFTLVDDLSIDLELLDHNFDLFWKGAYRVGHRWDELGFPSKGQEIEWIDRWIEDWWRIPETRREAARAAVELRRAMRELNMLLSTTYLNGKKAPVLGCGKLKATLAKVEEDARLLRLLLEEETPGSGARR